MNDREKDLLLDQHPGLILTQALMRNEARETGKDSFEYALEVWASLDQGDRAFADNLVRDALKERGNNGS